MSRRVGAVVAAASLAVAGIGLSAQAAARSNPVASPAPARVFGYGQPGFMTSLAPQGLVGHDSSGEPSIGVDWRTGNGMFMNGGNMYRLTFDKGTVAWSDVSAARGFDINLDPIMVTEPRTGLTLAGGDDGACSLLFATTDDGTTWTPSLPCTFSYDHPTVGYAPSVLRPGSDTFYYCQQGPDVDQCATSFTNGTQWNPPVPLAGNPSASVAPQTCIGLFGHLRGSADGTAYLPSRNCFLSSGNTGVGGMETSDDGLTWSEYLLPGQTGVGFDPAVVTTPDNTVYEGWQDGGTDHPLIAVSHNHGATWTTPIDLARSVRPALVAATFPTLTAGDNGRVAYSFLGTSVGAGNPNTTGFKGIWYLYTSFTYDGGKHWTTVKDTPQPMQYGEVDNGGTLTSGQRNLLDFIDSSVTKDGRVVVAYVTGCLSDCVQTAAAGHFDTAIAASTHAWASVAFQTSGRGLFAAYDVKCASARKC